MKSDHATVINQEGSVLSSFDHPNIIKFRNFYETNSRLLMEMELCRGGTLKNLMKKRSKPFAEDEVLVIMQNLLKAI
jgi:serine/threonine protein kinase